MKNATLFAQDTTPETLTRQIFFKLVNTKTNRALLSRSPSLRFYDMSVIFYFADKNNIHKDHRIIRSEDAEKMGLNENDLYKLALSNTRESFGVSIIKLENLLKFLIGGSYEKPSILLKSELDEEMIRDEYDNMLINEFREDLLEEIYGVSKTESIYVLSNSQNTYGAVCMLYKEIRAFADQIEDDLHIIPSSIHEVLLIPASNSVNRYELENILRSVNDTMLSKEELLSEHVYKYTRKDRKILY